MQIGTFVFDHVYFVFNADWNFFLKKWWVRWTLWKLHPYTQRVAVTSVTAFMATQQDEVIETPRMLIGENEVRADM